MKWFDETFRWRKVEKLKLSKLNKFPYKCEPIDLYVNVGGMCECKKASEKLRRIC